VSLYLRNTTRKRRLPLRRIERVTRELLAAAGEGEASLSLSFVGDAAIRRLNREHRGKDRATDVLSFPLYEPAAARRKGGKRARRGEPERLLGDIVISVDAAARQAAGYGATLAAEIERLLIHGILHLLGHDHEVPAERRAMLAAERRLARAIGLPWPYLEGGTG
jgi:probable rRNA maturation factor